ncbi:MAG TPA: HAMP domain-containing sensor histidine kinase [Pseudomonadales bacterium]
MTVKLKQHAPHHLSVRLNDAVIESAAFSERHFVLYGCLAWLGPLATVHDVLIGQSGYDTFPIRLSAAVLALPLIFSRRAKHLSIFPYYFVFIVTYGFPFSFGYMLIANAASAPPDTEIHMIWIFQYFVALFLFIQLINHGALTVILWVIVSFACGIPIILSPDPNLAEVERVVVLPVFGYLTALIFGILTNRNIDIVNTEKVRTAAAIGSNIAHELRTPLASIRSIAGGMKRHLPSLIAGYERARAENLVQDEISTRQIAQITRALSTIESEVEYSNTVIDMLLVNTADKPLAGLEYDVFTASSVMSESFGRYPFNNANERALITLAVEEDFEIHAPRLLVVHVLFNLIKNALYYVQRAGKGSITISCARRCITVHDTGSGISRVARSQVFDRFYTTTSTGQGAGIGLSFCKMVMESIGGSITFESAEDEHTTFILEFPAAT